MISPCPRCQKQVSIPSGVDSSTLVRCPLCSQEYVLGEVLMLLPPELVPVTSPVDTNAAPATETKHEDISLNFILENEMAADRLTADRLPAFSKKRRKPKSMLQTLIEVIVGGLAGCLVAYYILAFHYGPTFHTKGLPKIPLPGIAWLTSSSATDFEKAPENLTVKKTFPKTDKANPAPANQPDQDFDE